MKRGVVRTCLACRERTERGHLIRLSVDAQGKLVFAKRKQAGARGGYLHPAVDCVRALFKRKSLGKAFRQEVVLPEVHTFLQAIEARGPLCTERQIS